MWAILQDESAQPDRRFHAAAALADYVPASDGASWSIKDLPFVARQLVSANPEFQPLLRDYFRPISRRLLDEIKPIFSDRTSTDAQRLGAANAFADYAFNNIPTLTQLLTVANSEQFAVLYPIVEATRAAKTIDDLSQIAKTLPPAELGTVERIGFGQIRANAAVTLLRLGEREKALSVFDMADDPKAMTDDPEALTQFIFRCRGRGIGVAALLDLLELVSDDLQNRYRRHAHYALLLALGEYKLQEIPESQRGELLTQLEDWYLDDPSSGVHGAAGWLLCQWGQIDRARKVDEIEVPYTKDREWFTLAIKVTPTVPPKPPEEPEPVPSPQKTFYFTFIVFPKGDFKIGSFADEPSREKTEVQKSVTLTQSFAPLDREITFEEPITFSPQHVKSMDHRDVKPTDAGGDADWYDSVTFCRWLTQQRGLAESDQPYADTETLDEEQYPRDPNRLPDKFPLNWPLELGRQGVLPTDGSRVGSGLSLGNANGFQLWKRRRPSREI